jgi:lipopolysaccharide/colanic/teichoic acid biosynthesis glycosyltransferase
MALISPPLQDAISIDPRYLRVKRIIDVLFTLLILLPLCIFVLIVAVLIRLDFRRPYFLSAETCRIERC